MQRRAIQVVEAVRKAAHPSGDRDQEGKQRALGMAVGESPEQRSRRNKHIC